MRSSRLNSLEASRHSKRAAAEERGVIQPHEEHAAVQHPRVGLHLAQSAVESRFERIAEIAAHHAPARQARAERILVDELAESVSQLLAARAVIDRTGIVLEERREPILDGRAAEEHRATNPTATRARGQSGKRAEAFTFALDDQGRTVDGHHAERDDQAGADVTEVDRRDPRERKTQRREPLPPGEALEREDEAEQRRHGSGAAHRTGRIEQSRGPDDAPAIRSDIGGDVHGRPARARVDERQLARHPPVGIVDLQHADDAS
jgi:hypothetical protein